MDLNPDEVRIKQEMADACERVIGILDGTKWHRSALLPFVPPDQLDAIVTDTAPRRTRSRRGSARGVEVTSVEPRERAPAGRATGGSAPSQPRRRRLMATMVAVDLGAQSGRVVARALRRRAADGRGGASVPERPGAPRGTFSTGTSSASSATCSKVCAPQRVEAGSIDSVGVDSWGSTSACSTARAGSSRTPSTTATRAGPRRSRPRCRVVPARELYERTGIQHLPINTIFELAALAADDDPVLEVAETLLLIPDLMHYWLGGRPAVERTNATTTQCWDAREGAWAFDILERLEIPARLFPEIVRPGTELGSARRRGRRRHGPRRCEGDRARDARHRLGGRGRPVPASSLRLRQRRHLVVRRRRARAPGHRRPNLRRQRDQRGRRRRDLPPAPERHRPLAPARVPPYLGARGP